MPPQAIFEKNGKIWADLVVPGVVEAGGGEIDGWMIRAARFH